MPKTRKYVILCEDCAHWTEAEEHKNYPNHHICAFHSFMHGFLRATLPDDYCSFAVQKKGLTPDVLALLRSYKVPEPMWRKQENVRRLIPDYDEENFIFKENKRDE